MSNHSPLRELLPVTSSQHSSIPYGSCMSVYSAYFSRSAVSWVSQQDTICDGEIGIFGLNNEAYIKIAEKICRQTLSRITKQQILSY